jgi:Ca2+/Na+ antiporter
VSSLGPEHTKHYIDFQRKSVYFETLAMFLFFCCFCFVLFCFFKGQKNANKAKNPTTQPCLHLRRKEWSSPISQQVTPGFQKEEYTNFYYFLSSLIIAALGIKNSVFKEIPF